ncbi:hypothetical protein CIB48_g7763 [Xylaria polymorpha]|nr:hypothetical protein CIB48_g7763 [Xylaria polymorpha]
MGTFTIRKALVFTTAVLLAPCWAVVFTNTDFTILQGKPFTLQWEGAKGPVDITLVTGDSANIRTVSVIDSGDTGNSYTWTPPSLLLAGTYAFEITDGEDTNFSPQWEYDSEENKPTTTTTSSPPPVTTSTRATTTTTVPTTQQTTTTSPKTTTTTTSDSEPQSTSTTSSSANDSGDTSSSSPPTSTTTGTITSTTSSASTSPGSQDSESSRPSPSSGSSSSTSGTGTHKPTSSGLSTGAKIGIGLGAGLGGVAVLGVALLLVFRRGKAAGQRVAYAGTTNNNNNNNPESKAELGGDPRPRAAELGGQGVAEMQSGPDGWRPQPSELEAPPYSYRGIDMVKT